MAGSSTSMTRSLPSLFARQSAASPAASSSLGEVPCCGSSATPTEAVIARRDFHDVSPTIPAVWSGCVRPAPGVRNFALSETGKQKETQRSYVSCEKGCGTYGVVLTVFTTAESEGKPWVAMKKLWSYMLRYMRPAISAALGPKVGRPPCRKTTTTTRPTLVLA
jgi:hypothetical protein